jgi:DNA-binding response OmpR family regulator
VVVVDPDVAALSVIGAGGDRPGPAVVGWLTARSSARAAMLFDAGASEVLDAAMGEAELGARVRRVVRDHTSQVPVAPVAVGGLTVDARRRESSWNGTPLALTPREAEVLQVLVAAGGAIVSREVIYRQVWRWAMPRGDRTVDVNVRRMRSKLAAAGVPVEIVTQPGVGYRLRVGEVSERSDPPVVTGL